MTLRDFRNKEKVLKEIEEKTDAFVDPKGFVIDVHKGNILKLPKGNHLSKSQAYQAKLFISRLLIVVVILVMAGSFWMHSTCPTILWSVCERLFWQ